MKRCFAKEERKVVVVHIRRFFGLAYTEGAIAIMEDIPQLNSLLQEGWQIVSVHLGGGEVLESRGGTQGVVSSWMVQLSREVEEGSSE